MGSSVRRLVPLYVLSMQRFKPPTKLSEQGRKVLQIGFGTLNQKKTFIVCSALREYLKNDSDIFLIPKDGIGHQ